MRLLAIDTTDQPLSLALGDGQRCWAFHRVLSRPHDETLFPQVRRLLKRAGWRLEDIAAVAAASGPGRFTGIRIGLTFAVMLGKALGRPVVSVSRFEAAAARERDLAARRILAAFPGVGGELFCQAFVLSSRGPKALGEPIWVRPPDAGSLRRLAGRDVLLCGPAAQAAAWLLGRFSGLASRLGCCDPVGAADLLEPARRRLKRGRLQRPAPLYIKPAKYERAR